MKIRLVWFVCLSAAILTRAVYGQELTAVDFKSDRPTPRMADGHPDFSGYWKGTRDTRPGGNIGKDLPGFKLPLTPAGEAAGGDKRGKQAAALIVYTTERYPALDIRIDDHAEPISELRRLYEPYIHALATYFHMKVPPWFAEDGRQDNWQASAWDRRSVGRKAGRDSDQHDGEHF